MRTLHHILHLGIKELRSLWRDPMLLGFIILAFTVMVYVHATAEPESLQKAPIAVVDEDQSQLSERITAAFYPPHFLPPARISISEVDKGLDAGLFTFALNIPPDFQRNVLAGRHPVVQLNVDATRMLQAFTGSGYVQAIVLGEVNEYAQRHRAGAMMPVGLVLRARFNPE